GFHQCDPRRISAAGPTLRGRVSSPYGGVAPRWEAPDRPPFQRVPALSLTDPGRSAAVYSRVCEDVLPAGGPGTPLWPYTNIRVTRGKVAPAPWCQATARY